MTTSRLLEGRVAFLTGAGRGIGRATALHFAGEGAAVAIFDLGCAVDGSAREEDPADEVARLITEKGGRALAIKGSVTEPKDLERGVAATLSEFGKIDALVTFAGIVRDKSIAKMGLDEHVKPVVETHGYGMFNAIEAVLPQMRHQGYGRIVGISSAAGQLGAFGAAGYAFAKGGVIGFIRSAAIEGPKYGIYMNVYNPSGSTRITDTAGHTGGTMRPDQDPAKNGGPLAFLCSDRCTANGQVFRMDGFKFQLIRWVTSGELDAEGPITGSEIADRYAEVFKGGEQRIDATSRDPKVNALQDLRERWIMVPPVMPES